MPRPKSSRALAFYRAAFQRFDDAESLFERDRLTGAFYLAGYGVECILKALILSAIHDPKRRQDIERSFRGQPGHDFETLRRLYVKVSGCMIPHDVALNLATVKTWKTDLRYETSVKVKKQAPPLTGKEVKSRKEVKAFLDAVADVLRWANERMNDGSNKTK